MSIIDPEFTIPGADMPPQQFRDLRTQQGQINWLAQFLMSVNEVFDNVSGDVTTLEPEEQAHVDVTFNPETHSAYFHFYVPRGFQGVPGVIDAVNASAVTVAYDQQASATASIDQETNTISFSFEIPQGDPPTGEQIASAVDAWLVAHPEATTTVQDGSITNAKLVQSGGILSTALQYKRYLTVYDNVETLDQGIYVIPVNNKPSGLPSNYPTGAIGILVCFYTLNNNGLLSIASASYEKKLWVRTTYGWSEIPQTSDIPSLSEYLKYNGVLPANTNIRTAPVGSYALYPTSENSIIGLPEDYNGALYGHALIMHSSSTAPYIILTESTGKTWITMSSGSWFNCSTKNTLKDVNITVIGDSITQHNFRANKCWVDLMSDAGFSMQNLGIGGTGFANPGIDTTNRYIDRIGAISQDVDLIGISSSFNDVSLSLPVGNVDDTGTDSICGYINSFFDSLIETFPTTPICCYTLNAWGSAHYGQNNKATDYVDKFTEICKIRGLPYLSLYTSSGMYPWIAANAAYYFTPPTGTPDTIHPNDEGHKLLFRKLLPHFMTCAKLPNDYYINQLVLNA